MGLYKNIQKPWTPTYLRQSEPQACNYRPKLSSNSLFSWPKHTGLYRGFAGKMMVKILRETWDTYDRLGAPAGHGPRAWTTWGKRRHFHALLLNLNEETWKSSKSFIKSFKYSLDTSYHGLTPQSMIRCTQRILLYVWLEIIQGWTGWTGNFSTLELKKVPVYSCVEIWCTCKVNGLAGSLCFTLTRRAILLLLIHLTDLWYLFLAALAVVAVHASVVP